MTTLTEFRLNTNEDECHVNSVAAKVSCERVRLTIWNECDNELGLVNLTKSEARQVARALWLLANDPEVAP
jgi:hypothetical protein